MCPNDITALCHDHNPNTSPPVVYSCGLIFSFIWFPAGDPSPFINISLYNLLLSKPPAGSSAKPTVHQRLLGWPDPFDPFDSHRAESQNKQQHSSSKTDDKSWQWSTQYNRGLQCCTLTRPSHKAARVAAARPSLNLLLFLNADKRQNNLRLGLDHHLMHWPNIPPLLSLLPHPFHLRSLLLPYITLIRLITPLAGVAMGLGEHASKGRSMDHIKGAAHKSPQHATREIKPLLPYIFHEIIHNCSALACGLSLGCF